MKKLIPLLLTCLLLSGCLSTMLAVLQGVAAAAIIKQEVCSWENNWCGKGREHEPK